MTRGRKPKPITTTVVRSITPIDVDEFLYAYAQAILEAKGVGPAGGPREVPPASSEAA